jgi:hypothetical protein
VPRPVDGGGKRLVEGEGAEAGERQAQAPHRAGDHDRGAAADISTVDRGRHAKKGRGAARIGRVGGEVEAAGRAAGELDRVNRAARLGDQHVAAGRKAAHPGLDGSKHEARRHGRVDGVAAPFEHGRAGLGRGIVLGGDDAVLASRQRLADAPALDPFAAHDHLPADASGQFGAPPRTALLFHRCRPPA